MTDEIAKVARLMKVTDAVIAELERQGVVDVLGLRRPKIIEIAPIRAMAAMLFS